MRMRFRRWIRRHRVIGAILAFLSFALIWLPAVVSNWWTL